ncbi:MAG: hypothetical protein FWE89_02510 [Syntrophaceae bacterium]|nr:hypothetical protein [Syntrophaceae bacterium]
MASSIRRRGAGIFFLSLLLFLAGGCQLRSDSHMTAIPEELPAIDRIAVVPFLKVLPDEATGIARCPLCGTFAHAQRFPGNPEQDLERLFLARLERMKPSFTVLDGEWVDGVLRGVASASLTAPLRQVLAETGRELGVDAVVAGYLYRFRERRGSAFTVEQPASVTFEMHLLRVSDGALLWRGYYDKTQVSLMEDLLQLGTFVRGRGRWMTAEELLASGIDQVMESFPELQPTDKDSGGRDRDRN